MATAVFQCGAFRCLSSSQTVALRIVPTGRHSSWRWISQALSTHGSGNMVISSQNKKGRGETPRFEEFTVDHVYFASFNLPCNSKSFLGGNRGSAPAKEQSQSLS